MSQYMIPTLTTLVQPDDTLGREAVQILVDVLEGKGRHTHIRVETDLRTGQTVRKMG